MQFVSQHSPLISPPDNTPPLSRSRSSSAGSPTKSTAGSSPSSLAVRELGVQMSNTMLEGLTSYSQLDNGIQHPPPSENDDMEEEDLGGVSMDGDRLGEVQRGRSGYHDHFDRPQPTGRPTFERQSSYSKRHSSFNTRRELPYPQGLLGSTHPFPSKDTPQDRTSPHAVPSHPSDSYISPSLETAGSEPTSDPSQNRLSSSSQIPDPERISSYSLPISDSMPYSSLPTLASHAQSSSARYTNPRPAPSIPTSSSKPLSETVPQVPAPSRYTLPSRQSPSPPLLMVDEDIDLTLSPAYPYRYSEPTPPPRVPSQFPSVASRPASLPHALTGNFARSSRLGDYSNMPPPQPPTILTPPAPQSVGGNRKPAPHEPFLPRRQPSSDNTYIAVETLNKEYILVVRLPGFQRDAITLAARRRRVLHVVADDWNEDGGHFERRITFGYDADLYNVKAEFDGEFLKIHVPRRIPGYGRPVPTQ